MLDSYYSFLENLNDINYIDIPLFIMSGIYLSTVGLMGYTFVKNLINLKKKKVNEVIIIRGVPGSGKNCLIYDLEYDNDSNFSIISSDDFFEKEGIYKFDRSLINKANSYSFQKFHDCLKLNIPRIYIRNINNNKWMYANYISLAYTYNYKVKIIEILCDNENYLYYFNKRSTHNPPMSYSKNVYNNWEYDENANFIEPYIGNFNGPLPGDSLPSHPPTNKEQLDIEMDEYNTYMEATKSKNTFNIKTNLIKKELQKVGTRSPKEKVIKNECIIDSDNEDEDYDKDNKDFDKQNYEEIYKTNQIIDQIKKKDIKRINNRKFQIIYKKK